MAKKSLEKFIEETKGTQVDVPWESDGHLKGQCVSLIQQYLVQCLEQPAKARGNAKDWVQTYVNEGLGHTVADQKTGDLIVFPNEADGYGHIAIYVDGKLYDQNNARHDNGCAGIGEVFSWDFVTLRPNTEVIVNEPRQEKSVDELAQEVIAGKYGNGQERKDALGNRYEEVQARVNFILEGQTINNEVNIDEIAYYVIRGDYGNGEERKQRLEAAGYDYNTIQNRVNELR